MQRPTERKLTPPKGNYNSRKKGEKSFNQKKMFSFSKRKDEFDLDKFVN